MYYTSGLVQFLSKVPGPGSYGEGGVPWAAAESKAQLSQGTVGLLERGGREIRRAITVGSDLAPGQYSHTAPLDQLLYKRTSTRGPYDLYSGERYQVPKTQVSVNTHTLSVVEISFPFSRSRTGIWDPDDTIFDLSQPTSVVIE